jgi:uncharacterized protein YggE
MKPARFVLISSIALCVSFSFACNEGDTVIDASTSTANGISVNGTGRATGTPDIVFLQLGVNLERTNVVEAREAAASAMQAVIDSLKRNGVPDKDIQTSRFTIQPQYDRPGPVAVLRGYLVTNVVSVKLTRVDTASKAIDDAAVAGGNAVVVQSIRFAIDDPTALESRAREAALKEARARAEELASLTGVSLGGPLSVVESRDNVVPKEQAILASRIVESPTPIQAGELEVLVTVNVRYAIK